ncbi:hypothetical protein [Streptomyces sp. VN1]|uniref:hypothetical protein n=1 Tax=Streptomyces sp. VN1 TaxID=1821625 RepID=UPI001413AC4C|nr:hypothetical protein [Streptomyces sp. VN1]QIP74735.1 hypothetical protein EZV63_36905 [Streptomyces sp. VN1]
MTEQSKETKAVWERTRELGRQLDEVNGRLDTLEGQKLADRLQELSLVVKKLADKPENDAPAVWNWNTFNPQQQANAWDILLKWVEGTFRVRWPRSYKEMLGYSDRGSSCWWQHPDMVESLTSLMMSHHWAYLDSEASPLRVAEWLGRWLPDAVRQGKFILEECKNSYGEGNGHKHDLFENKAIQTDHEQLGQYLHMLRTGEVPS